MFCRQARIATTEQMTGILAWNLATIADEVQQPAEIKKFAAKVNAEAVYIFRSVISELIARKHQRFAAYRSLIMEYQITKSADGFELVVASTPLKSESPG
jgi:hypothetical protein